MTGNGCRYLRPGSLEEAIAALAETPDARPFAGGTDLMSEIAEGIIHPPLVVDLGGIADLRGVETTRDGALSLGAGMTLSELHRLPEVRTHYRALADAARSVGTAQLRNQGTLGGNLCQRPRCPYYRNPLFQCLKRGGDACYAATGENRYNAILGGEPSFIVHPSDCAPALVALDAQLLVTGPEGEVEVGIADFFVLPRHLVERENRLQPGELITRILLPPPDATKRTMYLKFTERAWDFALVSVAASLTIAGGVCADSRIVLGGVAPSPWRAYTAEQALNGQRLTPAAIAEAAQRATDGAVPLEHNAYKVRLAQTAVRRCLTALAS